MESIFYKIKITIIFATSLILVGIVLLIILSVKFNGEDGYITDDAPVEWFFITLIPIFLLFILGKLSWEEILNAIL